MAFDASRHPEPEHQRAPVLQDEPLDYVDWGMRIVVFGGALIAYFLWLVQLIAQIIAAFVAR
ncbi:hypothetical protein [Terricaulis silvestris]|uniref:hypothetical protein n=1 Tax=Terricaulis silvestris TaxID=2686094 RepID=UPI00131DE2C3|nr:hypothetical protein [Terricaulis silvestris]